MRVLRTPDERFDNLNAFPFPPHYTQIDRGLRMAHVEAGEGPPVLMLHGEPTWSYLYRKMIPGVAAAGRRAIAPDLIGFGRSDKPADPYDFSYQRMVSWTMAWLEAQDLHDITLFCQDWGSLIGLRLLARAPERFSRVVLANGGLPTGDRTPPVAFKVWQRFARYTPIFPVARIIQAASLTTLSREELYAYDAPFPEARYKAGVRALPSLVPTSPQDPAAPANRQAWAILRELDIPFLTAFSDSDPVTRGGARPFQKLIPGAQGQPHITPHGGHFLQEDCPDDLVRILLDA